MNRFRTPHLSRLAALAAAALALASAPAPLAAASPCSLGFLLKGSPTIDGQGGDWADASRASSASDACVGKLHDADMLPYDVTVSTKRYMRGATLYLGFIFEVQDATETSGGNLLTNGERIAIQFDHNLSGGAQLDAADMRLVVTHRWESSMGDPNEVTNVQSQWGTGTMAAGICGGGPRWANVAAPANYSVRVRKDFPGGYRVELEFPASAIGGVSGDFGVAFQVVNDWGVAGPPNSAGNSFPAALPYTTTDNAVDGCNNSWRVPSNWGTGYWASAAGDVTISRLPVFWQSPDIVPLACGVLGYTYYPGNPCKLTLQATVHSTFTTPQTRNLLYLWADHGASPTVWRVVGMKKNVPIGAMANATQAADEWAGVPPNLPNHPCVRVYILPPVFQAGFDEADIMGISTAAELAQMESVYGVQAQHWAQKNISAVGAGTLCPNASCRVAALEGFGPRLAAYFGGQAGSLFAVRRLAAQEPIRRDTTRPERTRRPTRVFLAPRDRRALGGNNALVQIRAWGYSAAGPADSLKYVLAENLGGLLQAIPLRQLDEKREWPLVFTLGNPGRYDRTVFVTTETEVPRGGAEVRVDVPRDVFKANEQRVVRGTLTRTGSGTTPGNEPGPTPGGGGKGCPVSAGLAMAGLALLGLGRRFRRRE
ncbi:MAG TPA: hypothetical protein VF584_20605 [Longimicrobium sp.]|jgi:MYXO-CTERM domain-containing protein